MLLDKTLTQLAKLLRAKEISIADLVEESYQAIQDHEKQVNSFISVRDKNEVLRQSEQLQQKLTDDKSVLYGLPYSLKDAYVSTEIKTTCASQVLENFQPPYDATVHRQLKEAGAVLIGKNNQDAWGHGGSNENTDFEPTKNPWSPDHIPGGSSGGSAAAISSRLVAFAIGEDTGGSIRNPSSMCNISGLKVTYGRVSRNGAIAYASSLDSVGPMAKSVEDLALILEVIAGQDDLDASSARNKQLNFTQNLSQDIKGKIIGLPKEFFAAGLDSEVEKIVKQAAGQFEKLGAKAIEVSIPLAKYSVSMYYLTALSETSSNLARYDGVRYGQSRELFSDETKRRIILGTYALSTGYADEMYNKAQQARTKLIEEFDAAYQKCDVLLCPVTPSQPAKRGELINNPLRSYLEDMYTGIVNVAGLTSLSIPGGFTKQQLPVGFQLIGPRFSEAKLLQFGHQYQQVTAWHQSQPPLIK